MSSSLPLPGLSVGKIHNNTEQQGSHIVAFAKNERSEWRASGSRCDNHLDPLIQRRLSPTLGAEPPSCELPGLDLRSTTRVVVESRLCMSRVIRHHVPNVNTCGTKEGMMWNHR